MKLFLDDTRSAPKGWYLVKTASKAISFLKKGIVEEISLDHDLGGKKTGYDVAKWIEEEVAKRSFTSPQIKIHSANPVGRERIQAVIDSIKRFTEN